MAHYVNVSMPKAHAVALLGLARVGRNGLTREATVEERRGLESLEHSVEGKDRRKVNRFPAAKGKRMGFLDLRRKPA